MIHLDTSFLIRALLRGSAEDAKLRQWLHAGERLAISAIAWAEFLCGPLEAADLESATRLLSERIPFAEEDAALAARLFNQAGRRSGSLTDCMIAASALRFEAPVATHNPDDFRRFEPAGLTVLKA